MKLRPNLWWTMGLAATLAMGCGTDDDSSTSADAAGLPAGGSEGEGGAGGDGLGGNPAGGTGGAGGVGGQGEGGAVEADAGEPLPAGNFPKDGLWAVTVDLVEFSLKIPFQLEVDGTEATRTIDSAILRAVAADGVTLSDPLGTVSGIEVAPDGTFQFGFANVVLPGAFTPTGSDVEVTVNFGGTATGDSAMCGSVTGRIITLESDLTMSTFGGVPWDVPADQRPFSCDPVEMETFTPIAPEDCPELVSGDNPGFPSAGLERTFRLYVPSTWTAEKKYPLVFVWHGLGQTQDEIQAGSAIESFVDEKEIIAVVPDSQAEDKPGVEWDQLAVGENPDLVFFDDILTCVDKGYGVDLDRVHSTGLSAGGLWTTYLTMFRSEKIASSVAFSGGLLVPYPMPAAKRPMIVAWGGEEDLAFDQNFNTLAFDLIGEIVPAGHFALACNHGQGHTWEPEFTPWALQFLLDHPRTIAEEPYAAGIPEGFPEFCTIAVAP
jgi:predicted esterase